MLRPKRQQKQSLRQPEEGGERQHLFCAKPCGNKQFSPAAEGEEQAWEREPHDEEGGGFHLESAGGTRGPKKGGWALLTVVGAKSVKCLGLHRIFSMSHLKSLPPHQQFRSPIVQIRVLGLREVE